jgi:hypothetical protein
MAQVDVGINALGTGAAKASLESFIALEKVFPQIAQHLLDFIESGNEFIRFEHDAAASGAGELVYRFYPSDAYLELVAAVRALDGNILIVEEVHGWPVLSLGGCATASVAEAAPGCECPGAGEAL